ncbi:hypothetical protein AN640_06195 [Candidatus Epulonipiscium fishelsonii]|uniref:Uncharacterized protein n=1 Tax=Candidatus Epulonipiscium fishelsonii TaxID=77094 RepID=A0ACC8XI85_9FIRM|nr:hypothetical protein AN640_06195 [Epulopiscium sp. SCG-D08WGA-EpuloA1]OON90297.1 MAG: hypothetical protein ATN32_04310 [Epulopiscium sp. AS2M-Bin002]
MDKQIYQLLGICQKGRNIVSGEFAVKDSVIAEKAKYVIVSTDASDNTKKLFLDKCNYRKIPYAIWGDKRQLGESIGKECRVVIGVLDEKLGLKLKELIEKLNI